MLTPVKQASLPGFTIPKPTSTDTLSLKRRSPKSLGAKEYASLVESPGKLFASKFKKAYQSIKNEKGEIVSERLDQFICEATTAIEGNTIAFSLAGRPKSNVSESFQEAYFCLMLAHHFRAELKIKSSEAESDRKLSKRYSGLFKRK